MLNSTQMHVGVQPLTFTGQASAQEFATVTANQKWYHSFTFDNGYRVPGYWNVAPTVPAIEFPDLAGKTVLDIGTASGWFAFYFEQAGATVTAVEIAQRSDFNHFGYVAGEVPEPAHDQSHGRGFRTMKKLLGSQVALEQGSVYDLGLHLLPNQSFDIVFLGCILLHLRDPVGALQAARRVAKQMVIATTIIDRHRLPQALPAMLWIRPEPNSIGWWHPTKLAYQKWFEAAGFTNVDVERSVVQDADIPRPHQQTERLTSGSINLQIAHAYV